MNITLLKQNPLEKFFIFTIYQNETLALTGTEILVELLHIILVDGTK